MNTVLSFSRTYEVLWSDLDANKHLLNSSYVNYMTNTRMAFFNHIGFDLTNFSQHDLGPVALHEHLYYFKEINPGESVKCNITLAGLSKDHRFYSFEHRFYKPDNSNCALGTVVGGWISLSKRKLMVPPDALINGLKKMLKSNNYHTLTKSDLRVDGIQPE